MPHDLTSAFERMRRETRSMAPAGLAERKGWLRELRATIVAGETEFSAAISADFGNRSRRETLMCEVVPSLQAIDDALRHLGRWMSPERRPVALHFLPARNRVHYQPKGVVLIISPWNYPLQLAVPPLVAALAAGNRVVLKPSELTPRFSEVLKRRLEKALGQERVLVATGGADVAVTLTALPFDHILFTGSTSVGRKVMEAAAKNLTPVTLELGGKSPAIVHESYDLSTAARRIARGKLMNAGQTCIAPDYVLVPAAKHDAFIAAYTAEAARLYRRIVKNRDYTSIVSERHYARLLALADDARAKGAAIKVIDPANELEAGAIGAAASRKIAPVLLMSVNDGMSIMQEEIFGPLLPVEPYASLEEAIAKVNDRPRPLALYYFDRDARRVGEVLERTVSGGASVNDTIFHVAQEGLPFGGIGPSGMGSYHGHDGFKTFSHARGVFHQAALAPTELLSPPYGARFDTIIATLIRRFKGWR